MIANLKLIDGGGEQSGCPPALCVPSQNDFNIMKRPSRRSPSQKPLPEIEQTKSHSSNTAHFFMGNKILDELKILIRLAAPETEEKVQKPRPKRRAKARPLRDAA